jgi:hypothetical protein
MDRAGHDRSQLEGWIDLVNAPEFGASADTIEFTGRHRVRAIVVSDHTTIFYGASRERIEILPT